MKNVRYEYLPVINRRTIKWPNEARLALWIIPNIGHFEIDVGFEGGKVPDIRNYAWRDYSVRVGIWRFMNHGSDSSTGLREAQERAIS